MICGFLALGALSDTWTVATNSLPDEIKYFVQLFWDVFMTKLLLVHRKWTSTNLKILVQCRVHAHIRRTTNVPRYCTIKATVIGATKTSNLSRNIAAKLVEKRCCAFYIPHTTCLATKKMCCKLLQRVAESRGPLSATRCSNLQHIFFVARQVVCGM